MLRGAQRQARYDQLEELRRGKPRRQSNISTVNILSVTLFVVEQAGVPYERVVSFEESK